MSIKRALGFAKYDSSSSSNSMRYSAGSLRRSGSMSQIDLPYMEEAMTEAKREIYQFRVPGSEINFKSLEGTYEPGNRFQYAAITCKDKESTGARIRRLMSFSSRCKKEEIPLSKLPILKLIEDNEQFSLSQALPKSGKEYIRLRSVTGVFTPLDSAQARFCVVKVTLHDKRKNPEESIVQSTSFNSNLSFKFELSMDYCIPRKNADQIMLNFSREVSLLGADFQWAAIRMQLKIEESDFPYVSNLQPAMSILSLPSSMLDEHKVNPNHINTTILESDRLAIRDMYQNGDIADDSEPIKEQTVPVKYTQSTVAAKIIGPKSSFKGGKGWEHLDDFRIPLQAECEGSKTAEDEGSIDLNPIELAEELKRTSLSKNKEKMYPEPALNVSGTKSMAEMTAEILAERSKRAVQFTEPQYN
ncbi:movement protein [Brassica campestris chinensis coguvirus 1]|uniref:Movement protein n=1 Tax=Brassica campestris chinensis coguvirus 1 TaxID=2894929 RepID=A0A8K1Z7E5_9VIRU|nr:movement protein [Brassica campestris chinensis coguvirus 1]UFE16635.1 movement protein [Brassica campestris chinensis coguvirus 1]